MQAVFWIIIAIIVVASLAGLWMVFEKAGERGWKAIIPFYNYYILFRIGGHSGWWVLVLILPVLPSVIGALTDVASAQGAVPATGDPNLAALGFFGALAFILTFLVFNIIIVVQGVLLYDVARSFGKGLGFAIGLSVLPFIFWPILGFGKSEYRGPVAHPKMVAKGSGAHLPVEKVEEKDETPTDSDKQTEEKEEKKENKEAEEKSSESNEE